MKPDCYTCIHRGTVPGDTHSCCRHPKAKLILQSPFIRKPLGELQITSNDGRMNGWFMWPINFDPVWLETCNGYTQQKEK